MYDIVIIGAGVAGMSAALYALRLGKKTLIIEQENIGGQITSSECVQNFPTQKKISGRELADKMFEQIEAFGAELELDKVLALKKNGDSYNVVCEYAEYGAKSVIIATGVKHRHLELDGEEELIGNGISFCALCDGAFYKDKTVAVIGGGNTAFQDALFLTDVCKKVYLVHRSENFRAEPSNVAALEQTAAEILTNRSVKRLITDNGELKGIELDHSGKSEILDIDGLFVAIGNIPDNRAFAETVELTPTGFIAAGEDCKTSAKGVFVAGDCRAKEVRQLTTAVSDGTIAAVKACEYLNNL